MTRPKITPSTIRVIYLMGTDGKYIRLFESTADAQEMARSIEKHL